MSKHVLKSVALAIGALVTGSAMAAAVNLDAASPTAIAYANELTVAASTNLRDGAAADQRATSAFGASFGTNVTAYVRIDIAGGTFAGTSPDTMLAVNDTAGAASVSVAQTGTGFVIFAVTPTSGANLVSTNLATIDTDIGTATGLTVTDKTGVTMRYRLFETLTAASNPASNNTLKDTGAKSYAAFSNAYSTAITTQSAVSDVGASPSYTKFTGSAATKPVGYVTFTLASKALATGAAIALGDIFTATNTFTGAGDFTMARNADGTYTGAALTRVNLNTATDCSGTNIPAVTLNATTATFNRTAAQLTGDLALCVTAANSNEINPASYTLAAAYGLNSGFSTANLAATTSGSITRNGVRMVAPLVNQPTGWFSRLVMTNTGSSDRAYSISYLTEAGTTVVATGAGSSGTLAAGKTTLIDLPSVVTVTPGAGLGVRASLVVTVNAPQSEIDGLYQIVNPTGASVSNYILANKN